MNKYGLRKNILKTFISFIFLWLSILSVFSQTDSRYPLNSDIDQGIWNKYSNNSNLLYNHIASIAEECLQTRSEKVSSINDQEDWIDYISEFRKTFFSQFEEHNSPLNARVTGKLERDNFSVEKIIYESQSGLFVSGSLFIPKFGKEPHPAILVTIGHSQQAFRRENYQTSILNLVRNGFVVFTYDPIGQGERVQNVEKTNEQWQIKGSTHEHSYVGAQCLLAGYSINDHFILDGIRALDYLTSRPEVDASRIGMTGISGGGQQTAFLSAFDDRIVAAAPECYITSYHRLFESVGPQDAEQNPYYALKYGFEHADLLISRAPKPSLIVSATEDFFSIQGARETFNEVKDIYQIMSVPDNISMAEAGGVHGFSKDNRESVSRFFRTYLDLPGNTKDKEVNCFKEEELQISPTGQVSSSYGSKSIFDLNKEKAIKIISERPFTSPKDIINNREYFKRKVTELSGYDSSRIIESVVYTGCLEKETYKIERYFIQGGGFEYPIPFVFIKPYHNDKQPVILYLESSGKENFLKSTVEIETYINMGYSILAPDLIGMGDLDYQRGIGDSYIGGVSYNLWFGANLVGTSIAGMQASDLGLITQYLNTREDVKPGKITSIVKDELCTSYLHFAILNAALEKTILVNPLISFEDILMTKYYEPKYLWTAVPGAVVSYDIPQMLSLLSPHKLNIINPVNAKGKTADSKLIKQQLSIVNSVYGLGHSEVNLNIISTEETKLENFIFRVLELRK